VKIPVLKYPVAVPVHNPVHVHHVKATAAIIAFPGFLFLNGWQYGDLPIAENLHLQALTTTLLGAISCQLANVIPQVMGVLLAEAGILHQPAPDCSLCDRICLDRRPARLPTCTADLHHGVCPSDLLLLLVPFPILLFVSHEAYKRHLRKKKRQS
jgi:sodium/potassium-transporting ATPase subunit alpha